MDMVLYQLGPLLNQQAIRNSQHSMSSQELGNVAKSFLERKNDRVTDVSQPQRDWCAPHTNRLAKICKLTHTQIHENIHINCTDICNHIDLLSRL